MPVYKDEKAGTWYVKLYYTDYTGTKKQKMKRGFKRQRDAKDWERSFLEKQAGNPDMTFAALYELYVEDMAVRLKEISIYNKKHSIERHILPYFQDRPINQITVKDIRKWQNCVITSGLKETTQRLVYSQLNAIFNFAVKYYDLQKNPCKIAGSIGKSDADIINFWTLDEFKQFIAAVNDPLYNAFFNLLYFSGLRIGEALALTAADIDTQKLNISVTKTYRRLNGQDLIGSPKTDHSIRTVQIPPFLCNQLTQYMSMIYGLKSTDRLFPLYHSNVYRKMDYYCKISKVKKIRVHDLRHSHVSMLIDQGFPAMLIAERIGDTVDMVNNIYGHLYPNRHIEIANKLEQLVSK